MAKPTLAPTSMRISVFDIGRESMAMLVRHIGDPQLSEDRMVLDVELVPGGSCLSRNPEDRRYEQPLDDKRADGGGG